MLKVSKQTLVNLYLKNKLSILKIAKKLDCSNGFIYNKMKEFKIPIRNHSDAHKLVCGVRASNYIDGRCLKTYYCKDCGKKISFKSGFHGMGRCKSCCYKKIKENNIKKGRNKILKKYYCIECNREIHYTTFLYGTKKCRSCNKKGKPSPRKGTGIKAYCINCGKELKNKYAERCIDCYAIFNSGRNHWNWQGGKSFEPYPIGWNKTYKEQIRRRDKYTCQLCGVPEIECNRKLHVHHIDYNKENLESNNLVSLCQSCHMKTNGHRNHWINYFKGGIACDSVESKI